MLRTGLGVDTHAFAPGRPLILGGVEIPHDAGLAGHSDADVLTHAIIDALLGAAGLGDIGRLFPDTDAAWAGADSVELLRTVVAEVARAGYAVGNVDATVVMERPEARAASRPRSRRCWRARSASSRAASTSRPRPARAWASSAAARAWRRLRSRRFLKPAGQPRDRGVGRPTPTA